MIVQRKTWIVELVVAILGYGWSSSVPDIGLPIKGLTLADVRDMFDETHSGHPHHAIDILSPKGTPIHAVVSVTIRKLFFSKPGGKTIYEFDEAGVYCYYYAHLDGCAKDIHEGLRVEPGEVIGFVGSTGNADPAAPRRTSILQYSS